MSPELQCSHHQLVCPLQNITCQCVVTGQPQAIFWTLHTELIAQFGNKGQSVFNNPKYPATGKMLANGLTSNMSFSAELQTDPKTVECRDANAQSDTWSYSINGLFFEIFILPIQTIKQSSYFLVTQSHQVHQLSTWLWL